MKKKKSYNDIYGGLGKTMNLGLTAGVSIAICIFLGYKIDFYYATTPKGVIGGAMFGLIAGAVNMWEHLQRVNKQLKQSKEDEKTKDDVPQS